MRKKRSRSRFWLTKRGTGDPRICLPPPVPGDRWCWARSATDRNIRAVHLVLPDEDNVMFCTRCGKELEDRDRFCFECGTPTSKGPSPVHRRLTRTSAGKKICGSLQRDCGISRRGSHDGTRYLVDSDVRASAGRDHRLYRGLDRHAERVRCGGASAGCCRSLILSEHLIGFLGSFGCALRLSAKLWRLQ